MAIANETLVAPAMPIAPDHERDPDEDAPLEGEITIPLARQRVRVFIWEGPVRVTHWVTFGTVMILTVTGAYIASPFLWGPDERTMAIVRFIHMVAAFLFVASGLVRTYWLFAGNRFARWSAFIPRSRRTGREMVRQTGWYLFLRKGAPAVLGHNALAAGTYLIVFFLFLVQTVTGFALAGAHGTEPWATLFGWFPGIVGIQTTRLIHHLLMWAILAFMIHHVYSALLVDHWERNGLLGSIFTGSKFVTRAEIQRARDGGYEVQGIAE
jgi:Ni/Fe-hydrogenase 1 B-type cytochrome subunit